MDPPQPTDGYGLGTIVTATAKPAQGYAFKTWEGTVLSTSGNKATFTVGSDNLITAVFEEKQSSNLVWIFIGGGIIILGVLGYILFLRKRSVSQMRGN